MSGLGSRHKWSLFTCSCLLQFVLSVDTVSVAVSLPVWHTALLHGRITCYDCAAIWHSSLVEPEEDSF